MKRSLAAWLARRGTGAVLLFCALLALVVRACVAARTPTLYPDGVVDLRVAEALAGGRWGEALDTRFHPLLGALSATLIRAFGVSAEASARAICLLGSSLVAPACALSAALLVPRNPRRAALVAGVLAALHPSLARLGGQVLSYGPAHACLALGLLAALWSCRSPGAQAAGSSGEASASGEASSPGEASARPEASAPARASGRRPILWAAAAGSAIGLGYWARSDALASGLGLLVGLALAHALLRGRGAALRVGLAFSLGALLVVSPFVLALSLHSGRLTISPKKSLGGIVRGVKQNVEGERVVPPAESLDSWITREVHGDPSRPMRPAVSEGAAFALRKAVSAGHPLVVALALLGLLRACLELRRGRSAPTRAPPSSAPRALSAGGPSPWIWIPCAALGAFVAAHVALKLSHGYTSRLHQSAVAVTLVPLATWGLFRLTRDPRAHALVLGLCCALLLPRSLRPQLVHKAPEREVGAWLRERLPEARVIAGRGEVRGIAYFAGARFVDLRAGATPAESLAEARAAGATHWVLYLRTREPLRGELLPKLEALGAHSLPKTFESRKGDVRYSWRILELREP